MSRRRTAAGTLAARLDKTQPRVRILPGSLELPDRGDSSVDTQGRRLMVP
jgi:hypothetical protein